MMEFPSTSPQQSGLRKRNVQVFDSNGSGSFGNVSNNSFYDENSDMRRKVVRNLDLFPKIEKDLTVKTDRGGMVTLVGYGIITVLVLFEFFSFVSMNNDTMEEFKVDTSISHKMQVNINITFPSIACVDLHLDVMDVAGDSQMNIDETLVKKRLLANGRPMSAKAVTAEANAAHKADEEKKKVMKEKLGEDYCGPCYGAQDEQHNCCNDCDEVVAAYKEKNWNVKSILNVAEQCIREGKSAMTPKKVTLGEGCNLSGYMNVNRVNGNFHFALGEGVERDGKHIHLFVPDDAPNFNSSHIIHDLSFGPKLSVMEHGGLSGVRKIVNTENGGTGLFQYFIKVVPTTYVGSKGGERETNRYFFTERFRPLITYDEEEDAHQAFKDEESDRAGVHTGGDLKSSHSHHGHHSHMNSVLPGIFFIYEIYPFAVVVTPKSVPLSHLLIRIMALVGGVFTIVSWIDGALFASDKRKSGGLR